MKSFIETKPALCILFLLLGIVTTCAYDFAASAEHSAEWLLFSLALPFRLFTYTVLFATCPLLAGHLAVQPRRAGTLAFLWTSIAATLALSMWWYMGQGADLYFEPSIKRMTPDMISNYDPDWTTAEIALGREGAAKYTWTKAIVFELLAILVVSSLVALFLTVCGRRSKLGVAYAAPILSGVLLLAYTYAAPWAMVMDFDDFIGDALLGTMTFNAIFFPMTVIYGGFTLASVWVSLISVVNVCFIAACNKTAD